MSKVSSGVGGGASLLLRWWLRATRPSPCSLHRPGPPRTRAGASEPQQAGPRVTRPHSPWRPLGSQAVGVAGPRQLWPWSQCARLGAERPPRPCRLCRASRVAREHPQHPRGTACSSLFVSWATFGTVKATSPRSPRGVQSGRPDACGSARQTLVHQAAGPQAGRRPPQGALCWAPRSGAVPCPGWARGAPWVSPRVS